MFFCALAYVSEKKLGLCGDIERKKTGKGKCAESEREDIERGRCENANMRVEQGWEAMKEKSGKKTGEGEVCGEREKI